MRVFRYGKIVPKLEGGEVYVWERSRGEFVIERVPLEGGQSVTLPGTFGSAEGAIAAALRVLSLGAECVESVVKDLALRSSIPLDDAIGLLLSGGRSEDERAERLRFDFCARILQAFTEATYVLAEEEGGAFVQFVPQAQAAPPPRDPGLVHVFIRIARKLAAETGAEPDLMLRELGSREAERRRHPAVQKWLSETLAEVARSLLPPGRLIS